VRAQVVGHGGRGGVPAVEREGERGRHGGVGSSPYTLEEVGAPGRAAQEVGASTRAWMPRTRDVSTIEAFHRTRGGQRCGQRGRQIWAASGSNLYMGRK